MKRMLYSRILAHHAVFHQGSNDLYIGDPLGANKTGNKTLLMITLNSGRINPPASSMYRSYNRIPQLKSMHIMPRGIL